MALRRLFSKHFFNASKSTPSSASIFDRAIASSSPPPPPPAAVFHRASSKSATDGGFLRRVLLRRTVYHSAPTRLPEFLSLPVGEKLREKLRGINNNTAVGVSPSIGEIKFGNGISVEEARKILRASMVEKVKSKLKEVPATSISYSEFVRICGEACENREKDEEFARMMDETGNVIVLGNVVFLRPEQFLASNSATQYVFPRIPAHSPRPLSWPSTGQNRCPSALDVSELGLHLGSIAWACTSSLLLGPASQGLSVRLLETQSDLISRQRYGPKLPAHNGTF